MRRIALLFLPLAACMGLDTATDEASITGSGAALASAFELDRAGATGSGNDGCTSTRIDAYWMLTALHCNFSNGSHVHFYNTGGPGTGDEELDVTDVEIRDGTSSCHDDRSCYVDTDGLYSDLELLRLVGTVETGAFAVMAWHYPGDGVAGKKVGAGMHDDMTNDPKVLKQIADTTDDSDDSDGHFDCSTDDVNDGDSGGPFYVNSQVLGTLTGHDGGDTRHTSVPAHLNWILDTIRWRTRSTSHRASTTFSGSVSQTFSTSEEIGCAYACSNTSTCRGYTYDAFHTCSLFSTVTGASTLALSSAAVKFGGGHDSHASDPAAYVREDGYASVVHVTSASQLHELARSATGTTWQWRNLTGGVTSAPLAASPASVMMREDGSSSAYYRAASGHVIEISWNGASYSWLDLFTQPSTLPPLAAGTPVAIRRVDDVTAVVYRTTTGGLEELALAHHEHLDMNHVATNDAKWTARDLLAASGAPAAEADPAAYVRSDGITSYIYVASTDHRIHEIFQALGAASPSNGTPGSLVLFAVRPFGYVRGDGVNTIVYATTDNHLHELSLTGGSWGDADMTALHGAPVVLGGVTPTGYARSDGVTSIVYPTSNGHVIEVHISQGGNWSASDLTADWGGPLAVGSVVGYVRGDGIPAVSYESANGHVNELTLGSSGWIVTSPDPSAATGETSL
ncbi:MAG TPA: trypsin-like serine protease [Kofleriaceae bacterium]|jgi:hypothetical protein